MDTQGRQKPQGRLERQGAGLCKKAGDEFKTASARRGKPSRLFLRQNDWDEEEVDFRENRERPEQPYQQEPTGMELLK